ncbi:sacsin isoform X1 [Olea europaea subsp. europaea]|uniref:Sacsin isoform X1 n=1 Tax=Olea europaea subsp. europaea TaxID=158383 RepID=A0A8S0UVX8_OLEEU|nr:sacsin isoform X1 [Olea europaea subsp. europaea]
MSTIILLFGPVAATMENLYEDGLDIKVIISNLVNDLNIEEFWSELRTELQKQIPLIYSSLQEYIDTDDLQFLKTSLNGVHWVWIGDEFVAPDTLAFDFPVKFSPYLYTVPSEL